MYPTIQIDQILQGETLSQTKEKKKSTINNSYPFIDIMFNDLQPYIYNIKKEKVKLISNQLLFFLQFNYTNLSLQVLNQKKYSGYGDLSSVLCSFFFFFSTPTNPSSLTSCRRICEGIVKVRLRSHWKGALWSVFTDTTNPFTWGTHGQRGRWHMHVQGLG